MKKQKQQKLFKFIKFKINLNKLNEKTKTAKIIFQEKDQ